MQTTISPTNEVPSVVQSRGHKNRRVTKSPKHEATERLTCYLSPKQRRTFEVHALYLGMNSSQYLQLLIDTHCKRFVVSDKAKPDVSELQEVSAT